MKLIMKLHILFCSLIILLTVFVNNVTVAERNSLLLVDVVDVEQMPVQNLTLYLVKDPISNPQFLSTTSVSHVEFPLEPGVYSVSAYAPDHGWDARIVELDEGQTRMVVLKAVPLVERWVDKNGNQYTNLTEWPWTAAYPPISISEENTYMTTMASGYQKILLNRQYYYNQEHKTGEVYSCPYLTVDLTWKFHSYTETVASIDAGPLHVKGHTIESAEESKNYPNLSNGESRTVYHEFDDCYEVWWYEWIGPKNGEPEDYYEEVWYESFFYGGTSGWYSTPHPSPTYKDHADKILNAVDYPPNEQGNMKIKFNEMEGGGFGVGDTFTFPLGDVWYYFVGPVVLGADYLVNHYTEEEAVYDFLLWGGHKVNAYYWNIGSGCMVTYNLTHVPLTVRTYELGGGEKTDVNVWINSIQYSSPVENLVVDCGDHTVEVESPFYQNGHRYAFQYWEDGNTSNPRTFNIANDTTLRAYYIREPVCAMKTLTNGSFYIPNIATDLLKVEMLFDNQNLTGDQHGATSPYSSIEHYPDGKVDMRDIGFIANKVGSNEGQSGWDYMADVFPDRKIDMKDVATASANFGKRGTYITDLSGVTVIFNTSEEISPDNNGFVTIPQDATNFNVTRFGNPIGAMITFW